MAWDRHCFGWFGENRIFSFADFHPTHFLSILKSCNAVNFASQPQRLLQSLSVKRRDFFRSEENISLNEGKSLNPDFRISSL
jgi:hypothetical protein